MPLKQTITNYQIAAKLCVQLICINYFAHPRIHENNGLK